MPTPLGYNCAADKRHLGFEVCKVVPGNEKGHVRMPKGTEIDLDSVEFNYAYVMSKVQDGTFEWLSGMFSQITETPESGTEQAPTGELAVTQKGMGVTTAISKAGYEFHSSVYGSDGNSKYDVMPIFEGNVIMAAATGVGRKIKGFSTSMYDVDGFQFKNGTAENQTVIKYQMNDQYEFNTQGVFLTNFGFNAISGIKNITDVNMKTLALEDGTIISAYASTADSKVYFPTSWARNEQFEVGGFAALNFKLLKDGVPNTISGTVTRTAHLWAVTPTGAVADDDVYEVILNDAVAGVEVAKLTDGRLYAGSTGALVAS